jgi:hypothetical protein
MKIFSIIKILNFWLRVWNPSKAALELEKKVDVDAHSVKNDNEEDASQEINTSSLNNSLLAEFVLEALPQVILQALNNSKTKYWSFEAYFSTVISIVINFMSFSNYVYWMIGYKKKTADVPLSGFISVGLHFFGCQRL